MSKNIEELQKRIKITSHNAQKMFEASSYVFSKEKFLERGSLVGVDNRKGAVYVYYKNETPLYVGETGRGIKERIHYPTSKHAAQSWWKVWTEVRFIAVSNRSDRILLEMLLILAYEPKDNKKPGARKFDQLFIN